MADDEEKEEPRKAPPSGERSARQCCWLRLCSSGIGTTMGERVALRSSSRWETGLSIVPEWNSQNQTFDNYMLNVDDDGKLNYDGDMNWDSLFRGPQAVERFMGIVLFEHMSEAFISLPEGMNYLHELSKGIGRTSHRKTRGRGTGTTCLF